MGMVKVIRGRAEAAMQADDGGKDDDCFCRVRACGDASKGRAKKPGQVAFGGQAEGGAP